MINEDALIVRLSFSFNNHHLSSGLMYFEAECIKTILCKFLRISQSIHCFGLAEWGVNDIMCILFKTFLTKIPVCHVIDIYRQNSGVFSKNPINCIANW